MRKWYLVVDFGRTWDYEAWQYVVRGKEGFSLPLPVTKTLKGAGWVKKKTLKNLTAKDLKFLLEEEPWMQNVCLTEDDLKTHGLEVE